jgi:hypothetical protein
MLRALELRKAVDAGISRSLEVIEIAWVTAVEIFAFWKRKNADLIGLGETQFSGSLQYIELVTFN